MDVIHSLLFSFRVLIKFLWISVLIFKNQFHCKGSVVKSPKYPNATGTENLYRDPFDYNWWPKGSEKVDVVNVLFISVQTQWLAEKSWTI